MVFDKNASAFFVLLGMLHAGVIHCFIQLYWLAATCIRRIVAHNVPFDISPALYLVSVITVTLPGCVL
jgi:hypothetical protein